MKLMQQLIPSHHDVNSVICDFFHHSKRNRMASRAGKGLIIEDDVDMAQVVVDVLRGMGRESVVAGTVAEAKSIVDKRGLDRFAFVIAAYYLPDGIEFIDFVIQNCPAIPIYLHIVDREMAQSIAETRPRLTPIIKGDYSKLVSILSGACKE